MGKSVSGRAARGEFPETGLLEDPYGIWLETALAGSAGSERDSHKGKNGKIYYYTINGQNGKVCGELPVDYKKLSLISALITGVVFLLGLAGGLLL